MSTVIQEEKEVETSSRKEARDLGAFLQIEFGGEVILEGQDNIPAFIFRNSEIIPFSVIKNRVLRFYESRGYQQLNGDLSFSNPQNNMSRDICLTTIPAEIYSLCAILVGE